MMFLVVAALADISNARAVLRFRLTTFFNPAVLATSVQVSLLAIAPILSVSFWLSQHRLKGKLDILLWAKLLISSLLSGCCIYDYTKNHLLRRWPYYDADPQAIACLESGCLIWLLYLSHVYTIQPSFVLSVYLAFSIAIHGAQWWMEPLPAPDLPTVVAIGHFCLLILHEIPKWHLVPRHRKNIVGLQSTFGIVGRSTAIWLYPTLFKGFWGALQVSDLNGLPPDLLTRRVLPQFEELWLRYRCLPRGGLAKACAVLNWKEIILSTIAKSIVTAGKLYIPCLAQQVIMLQSSSFKDSTSDASYWSKNTLISITFALFSALAVFNGCALYYQTRVTTILQGALFGSVFAKLLDLYDEDINESVSFSIVTGDIPEAMQLIRFFQDAVFYGIEAVVPLIMLWPYMGLVTLIPCIVLVGASKLANIPTVKLPSLQKDLEEKRQTREDQVNNSLYKIKEIKMTERGAVLHKILNEMRDAELEVYTEFQTQQSYRFTITGSCTIFAQVMSLYAQSTSPSGDAESKLANVLKCFALLVITSLSYDFAVASYWHCNRALDCLSSITKFLNTQAENSTARATKSKVVTKASMIQFRQAFVAPKSNAPAILKNIDLTIDFDTITIITGKAATGKTTFAKSLIRPPHVVSGNIHIATKSIGFCGQKSWLQHRSIKSNIIGPGRFDEDWYRKVLRACDLSQDIERYPGNDSYIIGYGGLQLTEAQCQKIALARAIYSQPALLVLDDAFAAIDRFSVEYILNRLFGHRGLLVKRTTVVITATDPAPFCNIANRFFTLDNNGSLSWANRDHIILEAKRLRELSMGYPEIVDQDAVKVHHKALPKEANVQLSQLLDTDQTLDKAPLTFYFGYVDRFVVFRFGIIVALLAVAEFSFQLIASLGYYSTDPTRLIIVVTAACALLYGPILALAGYHFYVLIAAKVAKELYSDLLNAVSRSHLIFLTPAKLNKTVRLFNEGMRVLTTDLSHGIFQSCYRLALIAVVCILLVWANYSVIYALPVIGIVAYLVKQIYYPTSTQLHHMQLASKASLQAHFAEAAAGTGYVHAFQWKAGYLTSILGAINRQQRVFYYKNSLDQSLDVVVDGLVAIIVALFLNAVLGTDTSPAIVGSAFVGCLYIQPELKACFAAWFRMDDGRTTLEEMRQIIQMIPDEVVTQEVVVPENWPTAGLIELKDVTIWYNRNEPPVLENITLIMHDASEVGLLGRPQTGKTALLLTVMNELPYTGSITIDGVEVRTIPRDKLAQQITVVPQEVIIFPGSVRQNLIPDEFFHPAEVSLQPVEDGEEGQVEEVKAYTFMMERILYRLGLLDIIKGAGGLDVDIAKVSMSTEQQHRFSLAQSLTAFFLRQTKITLIDDITSKVSHGDCVIMRQAIRELMGDVTTVAVAHHPSAIIGSDAIGEIKDKSASIRRRVIVQRDPDDEEDPGNRALLPTAYPVPEIDPTLPQNQLQNQPHQTGPSSSQSQSKPKATGPAQAAHFTSSQPPNPPAVAGPSKPKTQPQKQAPAKPVVPAPELVPVVERPVEIDPTLSARQRQKLPAVSLRKKVLQKQTRSAIISSLVKKSPGAPTAEPPKDQPSKADGTLSAKHPSSDSSQ
ncbi:hypothetical protein VHEMI10003 [[Torrubiella] hemipterigena]|uniref:ABC transporter n=1 Tax=[Torrubiella] hemipterigena TaxID=1531966 RepID=A0A0A1TBM2_9HYPO|nr:hypothetical protein VHEMI10003 [[Torrubiella] hemipterigena]